MERSFEVLDTLSSSSSFSSQARLAFEYSLKNLLWRQAAFFAERLLAENPCDETRYLLGLAYFHNQEIARAQWHVQSNKLPDAKYLLAKCCLHLKRWNEAEEALLPSGGNLADVVNGAAGLFLLGQVQERQARRAEAVECYAKCLELCPFMWEAYERWSWLVLGTPSPSRSSSSSMAASNFSDDKFAQSFANLASPGQVPVLSSPNSNLGRGGVGQRSLGTSGRGQNAQPRNEQPQLQLAKGVQGRRDRRDSHSARSPDAGQKESARRSNNSDSGEVSLASLLCKLGLALHTLHGFDCQQSVQILSTLPKRHFESGYVLDLVGLCHFESGDYRKSEQAYQRAWKLEPRRIEGLEYYSSALWQLKKDVELGRLAQECLRWDRLKPQVWCVVGNCFSLQKDHDVAIKFFKRAIQVDSSFAYAYTLCGHEFVASEKFDKAVQMYESALQVDPRHYNAWWGLGNIYHRQEEHENAKYHFAQALKVNSNHSVLQCYLGMVQEAQKHPLQALESFDKAAQSEPNNAMAYLRKASVFMSLDRFDEALEDLKKARSFAPKEATVHFHLGKVYMKLGQDRKALFHFNTAMDLNRDSKDYHTIKQQIERLNLQGVNEADASGEITLAVPGPVTGPAPARRPVQPYGHGNYYLANSNVAPNAGVTAPPGTSSPAGQIGQIFSGLSPPVQRTSEAPQTPAVRGAAGVAGSGGLWSAGASSGGHPRGGYPAGRGAGGHGRGGTPPSWAGTYRDYRATPG